MIGDILQPTHLLLILVVALIVLGPKRLPEVGRSLGRGLRDFRHALSGEDHEHESLHETAVAAPQPTAPAQPTPQSQMEAPAQPVPTQPLEQPVPVSTGAHTEPNERSE